MNYGSQNGWFVRCNIAICQNSPVFHSSQSIFIYLVLHASGESFVWLDRFCKLKFHCSRIFANRAGNQSSMKIIALETRTHTRTRLNEKQRIKSIVCFHNNVAFVRQAINSVSDLENNRIFDLNCHLWLKRAELCGSLLKFDTWQFNDAWLHLIHWFL